MTRREALFALAAAPAAAGSVPGELIARHDEQVRVLMDRQRENGSYPDGDGLWLPGAAAGLVLDFTAAFLQPGSKHAGSAAVLERIRRAAKYLEGEQTADGNIDLPTTNFNSPPDTGFVCHLVASAACLARRAGSREIEEALEGFLRRAGAAMTVGGIHTPNHRWVVCQALAQIHELYPDARYVRRIEEWLAEGIDIDEDGQFDERSTTIYNPVTDRALVVMAAKLKRAELLAPVRRNLESLLYLLHPGGEVVTEISRRQDQYQVGDAGRYWFPLRYMAVREKDGRWMSLAQGLEARYARLPDVMEFEELTQRGPAPAPLPENYEKTLTAARAHRIRRGRTSATVLLANGDSLICTLRRGEAVIGGVRFASAFFGKAQFVAGKAERVDGGGWRLTQQLEGPYFQPLTNRKVAAGEWEQVRRLRGQSEVARLTQAATVTETPRGLRVRVQAEGTDKVPLAIEINVRDGVKIEGARELGGGAYLLEQGAATLRAGSDAIRISPGVAAHRYVNVRGALPRIPGQTIYVTGLTPFDYTLQFEVG
ncbi:MAG: hypothetical protein SFV54_10675 [Bryobacteraceae bacterium]|nr:hypothetical protein [Bryobacteraceae bacterium]